MKKILLIENNSDHAELLSFCLKKNFKNVEISISHQGKSAFQKLKQESFDLILSDFYLPDSHGVSLIRKLVKFAPETPIIIITGKGDEKTATRSIQAGADDYIVKTKEALQALPKILKRTFTKHQASLKKKKEEMNRYLKIQQESLKKVFTEIEILEQKVSHLQKLSPTPPVRPQTFSIESVLHQVNSLKRFLQDLFKMKK